jgi:putative tryptophan/tyrosine transport system substrate-binding protein
VITSLVLGLALLGTGSNVAAQSAGKVHRVGIILSTTSPAEMSGADPVHPGMRAFVHALRAHGHVEGRNLVLDRRSAEGVWGRAHGIVAELVQLKTDVIVVANAEFAQRASQIAKSTPIVVLVADQLVARGLAKSLARPGGNVTGFTTDVEVGTEVKRLELFSSLLPKGRRIAFVGTEQDWSNPWGKALQDAAPVLRANLFHVQSSKSGYAEAFAAIRQQKPDAFYVARSVTAYGFRKEIGEFALASRLPSACGSVDTVVHGCLMSYGLSVNDLFVRSARYVDRILKGAKPADLPIERPSKFEFVVNLKTARAIGLTVPQSVLLRADRVIE